VIVNLSPGLGLLTFGYLRSSPSGRREVAELGGTYTLRETLWSVRARFRTVDVRIGEGAGWPSSTDDQFWPIFTAASWRMKPGGRPCFERISSQPLLESTTLSFIPGPMLAINGAFSLGLP
jgi:hypothetical protein